MIEEAPRRGTLVPGYDSVAGFVCILGLYLVVTVAENTLAAAIPIPFLPVIEFTTVLPVPLVLLMGPLALWGIPIGYILGDLVTNAIGGSTLIGAGVHLYFGYSAGKLARRFNIDTASPASHLVSRDVLGQFVLVIGVAAAGAAAIAGWGSETVHRTPFFVAASLGFVELFTVTLVCTVPLLGLFRSVLHLVETQFDFTWYRFDKLDGQFNSRHVAVATLTWLLLGTVGSVGYRIFENIPPYMLRSRGLEVLLVLDKPEVFGRGAGRVQVLFGAVVVSILVSSYLIEYQEQGGKGTRG